MCAIVRSYWSFKNSHIGGGGDGGCDTPYLKQRSNSGNVTGESSTQLNAKLM